MVANVRIYRWTGTTTTPNKTDVTGVNSRLSTSDSAVPGEANSVPVPPSGDSRSFWASFRLHALTAPDSGINNLGWYSSNPTFGTGVSLIGAPANAYRRAQGVVGSSGDVLSTANHSGLLSNPVNVETYTAMNPAALTGSTFSTGDFGGFFVMQFVVTSSAAPSSPGNLFYFRYDEF